MLASAHVDGVWVGNDSTRSVANEERRCPDGLLVVCVHSSDNMSCFFFLSGLDYYCIISKKEKRKAINTSKGKKKKQRSQSQNPGMGLAIRRRKRCSEANKRIIFVSNTPILRPRRDASLLKFKSACLRSDDLPVINFFFFLLLSLVYTHTYYVRTAKVDRRMIMRAGKYRRITATAHARLLLQAPPPKEITVWYTMKSSMYRHVHASQQLCKLVV